MGVHRADAAAMVEDHGVAVAAAGAGPDHGSRRGGADRRAGGRPDVDALVELADTQDRMDAPAVLRDDRVPRKRVAELHRDSGCDPDPALFVVFAEAVVVPLRRRRGGRRRRGPRSWLRLGGRASGPPQPAWRGLGAAGACWARSTSPNGGLDCSLRSRVGVGRLASTSATAGAGAPLGVGGRLGSRLSVTRLLQLRPSLCDLLACRLGLVTGAPRVLGQLRDRTSCCSTASTRSPCNVVQVAG